ncbi:MAG TPA: glycoside hydrolase family 57 [Nitrospiraceae bacterium]|jgi:alpha-amylase/alpha-mannosidase (GH57 family)|nr:glycoside hydrolase family 57 [Nitrospiraceae bacterium]
MNSMYHALILNLHQPSGNLEILLNEKNWEGREILFALDRIPRSVWDFADIARVHLSLSGTLLETLSNPDFQHHVYGIVDCGSLLWHFQNRQIFEILGTAYYHPVMPLIPPADRKEHLNRWFGIGGHLFWRREFAGFWPPEMAFTMELIPLLKQLGYRYVVVDSEYVEPLTPMRWEEVRYRPHVAQYGGEEIIVVVRDRELSNAQESGMEYSWFEREVRERTKWCDFPPLVITATDGDNGGWFRNVAPEANFWGVFYREMLDHVRAGDTLLHPVFIEEYLNRHGTQGLVNVRTGAWNTGWHQGADFVQWTGSQAQKDAFARIEAVSAAVHGARWRAGEVRSYDPEVYRQLEESMWHLLRAETSCNFYWGEAWVKRCHQDLDIAEEYLARAQSLLR